MGSSGFKPLGCLLALITVVVCVFDVITNWYAFSEFVDYRTADEVDQAATACLGCAAAVGTLVLFLALLNLMRALEAYGADKPEDKQRSVGRWEEVAFFLQIVVQDAPVAAIVYWTFRRGSCHLYAGLFHRSLAANVALVGSLSGSVWKTASAVINCFCGCVTEPDPGCGWLLLCCLCRVAMNITAAALIGFVTYQLVNYNEAHFERRLDCLKGTHLVI